MSSGPVAMLVLRRDVRWVGNDKLECLDAVPLAAKYARWHFDLLADDLESNVWNVRVAILESLKTFFSTLHVATSESKPGTQFMTSGLSTSEQCVKFLYHMPQMIPTA